MFSTATLVKNAEWVSTMGYKTAGSMIDNPHRFDARSWFSGYLQQQNTTEVGGGAVSRRSATRRS